MIGAPRARTPQAHAEVPPVPRRAHARTPRASRNPDLCEEENHYVIIMIIIITAAVKKNKKRRTDQTTPTGHAVDDFQARADDLQC